MVSLFSLLGGFAAALILSLGMLAHADEDEDFDWEALGEAAYINCASCHQPDGEGLAGVYPPLAVHAPNIVAHEGGREYLIKVVLYGLQGPITVLGEEYDVIMAPLPYLSDEDIAAALNYLLHAWNNEELLPEDFEIIHPEEVEDLRGLGLTSAQVHELRQELGLE